jgi:23S rRNA pseudouridine1911/1915/1917 synthase
MKQPEVIYEDNHLLVVHKPAGWLVQSDRTGDQTITDWGKSYIKLHYKKPGEVFLHPTHRLDRPVSGLVILARTSKGLERMNKHFREDKIGKSYLAICGGRPEVDTKTLVHYLRKDIRKNRTLAVNKSAKGAKMAELSYNLLGVAGDFSLLNVSPKTGRPHQIRVQLAKINCPIKGDIKYGYDQPNQDKSICLHAYKLEFEHPVKKEKVIIRQKPNNENWQVFKELIDALD